ncbi:acetyl-CoA carboxylase carboxyltransferase component [Rhodococcus sp. OK302]|nr:acetyl-CoA carboxylase carboxyltransferase component [Rhodococcus sp. OK302]
MVVQADMAHRRSLAVEELTGPGQLFEVADESVRGHVMPVFTNRAHTLREILAASVRYGDAEYLVCDELRITFADHFSRVASLAEELRRTYSIGKGDRVAILSANNAQWIVTFWAATSLGAIVVGMNAMWSAPEIDYGMKHSTPKLVVADAKRRELLGDVNVPVLSVESDVPRLSTVHVAAELPTCAIDEDDPAVILYTSGTTGRPKGATHSHRNVITANDFHRFNDALATHLGSTPADRRFLLSNPLFHIASLHNLAVPRLSIGDTAVIYSGRFDIDRVLRLIEREQVTNWGAVPTMANRLVSHGDLSRYDLSSLKTMSLGSAPSSTVLKEKVRELLPVAGRSLGTTYGLTESSTGATLATAADLEDYPDSVGRPVVTMSVEIRDDNGHRLPDGYEGEICLRGPHVMVGYWNNESATSAALDEEGWLRTGDLGFMADGHLRVSSRRSDLILRGGENIYPVEVENVLSEHPAVQECAVVGVSHEDLGEEVAAIVVVEEPGSVTEVELLGYLRERLAKYKVPSRWRLTTEPLPRNATGKVVRKQLDVEAEPSMVSENRHAWAPLLAALDERRVAARAMGGPDKLLRYRRFGRVDSRERIAKLLDHGTFQEIGILGGDTSIPSDGFVAGSGLVDGRPVLVGSEDFTVAGGSIGTAAATKRARIAELAKRERAPLIMLLEGAGHRATNALHPHRPAPNDLQAMAELSGLVPTVSIVCGPSAGHGALAAPMSDFVVMIEGHGALFTAGPPLVEASLGEKVTKEDLGGPHVHAVQSGVADNVAADIDSALAMARRYLSYFPSNAWSRTEHSDTEAPIAAPRSLETLLDILPPNPRIPYDMRDVLSVMVDDGSLFELQPHHGSSVITALARMGGRAVAVVANQPLVLAGALDVAAAEKATRFIEMTGAFHLPLIFLADNPGVLAGSKSERDGILRASARMFAAQHRSTVPKMHVTVRKAFGFGGSVMGQNAFDHQTISLSFPGGMLGGIPAAVGGRTAKADERTQRALIENEAAGPWRLASSVTYDDVIDPRELRNALLGALRLSAGRDSEPASPVMRTGYLP